VLATLKLLVRQGRVVRLTEEMYADAAAAEDLRRRVVAAFAGRESLTTLELKALTGTSRKHAIPWCEWLDRERVTLRVGDVRTLRGRR
jgi:selenocysteine-specific elongation factor